MTQPPSASADGVWRHLRLAPGLAQPTQPVADGAPAAMVVQQGVLRWLGPQQAVPAAFAHLPQHDACGAWATPGLIDCHTHLVYGGQRAHEFALRLAGRQQLCQLALGVGQGIGERFDALVDQGDVLLALGASLFHEGRLYRFVLRAISKGGAGPGRYGPAFPCHE